MTTTGSPATPSRPGTIEVRGLEKRYGRTMALSIESFTMAPGDYVVLFGRNGAGKSTFLRILASALRPTRGAVSIDGVDVRSRAAGLRAHMGYLGHAPSLYANLSGRENLRFFGTLHGLEDLSGRVEDLLGRVGLLPHADRLVREYSRGMVQRLALGRSFLHDPAYIYLDEPYTGLDPQGVAWLTGTLHGLYEEGRTLVVSEQDLDRGLGSASRSLLFDRGRIAESLDDFGDLELRDGYRRTCAAMLGRGNA